MPVVLNEVGITELLNSAGAIAHLHEVAEAVAAEVERIAPRHTGSYVDSIGVGELTKTPEGPKVAVESSDFAAHLVEFGSVNNPPYAPLRRAVRNLGLKVTEQPR